MPWKVVKDKARCGSGFALVNDQGELVACHKTKGSATAQQRALYAATAKADMPTQQMETEPIDPTEDQMQDWEELTERQQDLAESFFEAVLEYGMFDQSSKANGAHYAPAAVNPFKAAGMVCKNCIFYAEGANQCMIVAGPIEEEAICKLWIIPEGYIQEPAQKSDNLWDGKFLGIHKLS